MAEKFNQREYQNQWDYAHTKVITLKLNLKQDKDILDQLDIQESRQGYIKKLIRADIKKK